MLAASKLADPLAFQAIADALRGPGELAFIICALSCLSSDGDGDGAIRSGVADGRSTADRAGGTGLSVLVVVVVCLVRASHMGSADCQARGLDAVGINELLSMLAQARTLQPPLFPGGLKRLMMILQTHSQVPFPGALLRIAVRCLSRAYHVLYRACFALAVRCQGLRSGMCPCRSRSKTRAPCSRLSVQKTPRQIR